MIDIIIVDDNIDILKVAKNITERVCFQKEINCNILTFGCYDESFYQVFSTSSIKIFILDIEVDDVSGIDIAREIRSHSTEDIIIFLSAHEDKYKDTIFEMTLDYYCFVNKLRMEKLEFALNQVFERFCISKNVFQFTQHGEHYRIKKDDILFIESVPQLKKCVIHTPFYSFELSKYLGSLQSELGNDFVFIGRSHLINKQHYTSYSRKKRIITLDNGICLAIIPRRMKDNDLQELLEF